MSICAYLRNSTDDQADRHTIEIQRDGINLRCSEQGEAVDRWYEDPGISGKVPLRDRPQGRELLSDAALGKIDKLLIWKWDRLGRDYLDTLNDGAELKKLGVRVISITQPAEDDATGRLLTNILSAFGAHEWEMIRERSIAGTQRQARAGVWLGGIVPYGYRKVGQQREARLVPSTEPIPGLGISEAEVMQQIFTMAADGKSCVQISNHLNRIGVPPCYARDGRQVGKRKERTSGIWRPSRVRNLIVNETYKGKHVYGKRRSEPSKENACHRRLLQNGPESLVVRECPRLVEDDLWAKANVALRKNQIIAMAHPKNNYLLRGLVRCGLCGLNYIGMAVTRPSGKLGFYYRCNGKQQARALYGEHSQRCPGKSVRGLELEAAVWADLETFLAKPGLVLQQLKRMADDEDRAKKIKRSIRDLEAALVRKAEGRRRFLDLFAEGVIDRAELSQRLAGIAEAKAQIETELEGLRREAAEEDSQRMVLAAARSLLEQLRAKVDGSMPFETRRQIVEALVESILVETVEGEQIPTVTVTYRFEAHTERYEKWARQPRYALNNTDAPAAITATRRASAAAPR